MTEIDLNMFLANFEGRYALHEPWVAGERRWYTNGRVSVWEDVPGAADTENDGRYPLDIRELMDKHTEGLKPEDHGPLDVTKTETIIDKDEDFDGWPTFIFVWVSGQKFDHRWLGPTMLLPGVKYATSPIKGALAFLWDRGGGVVLGIDP